MVIAGGRPHRLAAMARLRPAALLPVTLLACSSPATSALPAASSAPSPQEEEEGFQPITFGDDEYAYTTPFFPGTSYDSSTPTADSMLGGLQGSRLAHHDEILACYRAWADSSPRMTLQSYGETHEGRQLVYAVVTSPANHARLDEVIGNLGKLHDPRGVSEGELERIVSENPACAWLGYSIHGDELSGADASLAFGYHLVAGQGESIEALLEELVVVIDPCMNPDGRERIIAMTEQAASLTPNLDYAGMTRGRWPHGRGNHYLFDMNRDWMAGTQPETRGRWRTARRFHPQLFVDAHEMWSLDTFLFYPQNKPLNPELPPTLTRWQRTYAEDAAKAFDRHGWSYYTREWADAWAPFYSDSWGSLHGATGMLYEQARTLGTPLRRRSGEILTYRESVHHQAVASLANVTTLARNREAALRDYLATHRRNVASDTPVNDRMLVVRPGTNPTRLRELKRVLLGQGIEATVAAAPFEARNVEAHLGETSESMSFPAGSIVVPARQPLRSMVRAYLAFDHRMPLSDLQKEREDLERKGSSRIYDSTSWSLPYALDVEAFWCDARSVEGARLASSAPAETRIVGPPEPVGWAVSGADDASVSFAGRAMELGLAVNISDKPFRPDPGGDETFPRGSLFVRRVENPGDPAAVESRVMAAARAARVARVQRVASGLAPDDGPDLGGGHFALLSRPRIAILANAPVAPDTYGHLWHHLDRYLGVPFTFLDAQSFRRADLRRYNVLVVPPGEVSSTLSDHKDRLVDWVRAGGTLIGCGSSAAAMTRGRSGISSIPLRRHALEDLAPFDRAALRDWNARSVQVSEAALWTVEEEDETSEDEEAEDPYAERKVPEAKDAWQRRFSPNGVTVRGIANHNSWLSYGTGEEVPLFFTGSSVLLTTEAMETAVRLAPEERLRLGGLIWPEARERLSESAWLARESLGDGQILLFAATPAYRGYHLATARLFANALVYGPGLGASQPIGW